MERGALFYLLNRIFNILSHWIYLRVFSMAIFTEAMAVSIKAYAYVKIQNL
jgi:hypothetical protein